MNEAKALTKKESEQALAAYGYDASASHDELDGDSYAIPRIAIIEALSPELDESTPEYLPEAKRGQLCNRVMGEMYSDGLMIIPVKRRRVYLEWTPRNEGGGFVAEHNTTEGDDLLAQCTRSEKNVDITPNGTELHNVLEFYVLASADKGETFAPAIISMSRTRMAEGKKWNLRIDNFMKDGKKIAPMAQVYELSTAKRDNPEGVSYVFKVGTGTFLPEAVANHAAVFAQAKGFLDAVDSGAAKVVHDDDVVKPAGADGDDEEQEF
jgi:hypothetical protein